jgi:hypothetical protein
VGEGGDPLGLDIKLAEEKEKSVILDCTLSGGLGGIVGSSGASVDRENSELENAPVAVVSGEGTG